MVNSWAGRVPCGEMGPDLPPAPGAVALRGGARRYPPPHPPLQQAGALPWRDRQSPPGSQGPVGGDLERACLGHVSMAWQSGRLVV